MLTQDEGTPPKKSPHNSILQSHYNTKMNVCSTTGPMAPKLSWMLVIMRRRKLANSSISLLLSFLVKKVHTKCERSRRDTTESLFSPKINTKIPTRTRNFEMNQIVTNSEINLHHCFCESRGFKIGRSRHRKCSIKKVFLKISQI